MSRLEACSNYWLGGIAFGKHMPSLAKLDYVKMVAFCISERRAERAAKEFGVEGAKNYLDYNELRRTIPLKWFMYVPNRSHAEITIAALEAGKHVMCEKPMAKTAEDARKMVEAAKRTGKKSPSATRAGTGPIHRLKNTLKTATGRNLFCQAMPPQTGCSHLGCISQ